MKLGRYFAVATMLFLSMAPTRATAQSNPVPALLPPPGADTKVEQQNKDGCWFLPPAEEPSKKFSLETFWNNQLRFESENKQFSIHIGGNFQVDSTWLIGPDSVFALPGGGMNGVDGASAIFLRRVRFRFEGQIYELIDYMVEYDLANANNENDGLQPPSFGNIIGAPNPCNVWVQIREVPWFGNVRFGNQVKPIGMTNNTNQAFLPFMERADNMDAFYGPFDGGFALGLTSRNVAESERATWQYGIYRPSTNVFGIGLNKGA